MDVVNQREQIECLQVELKQAHEHIRWLEQEVARLYRLLSGSTDMRDSLKTPKQ